MTTVEKRGEVSVGTRYLLNLKLIDVETGETIEDVSEKYSSIDELVDGSENIIKELFGSTNISDNNQNEVAESSNKTTDNSVSDNGNVEDNNFFILKFGIGLMPSFSGPELGFTLNPQIMIFPNSYFGIEYSILPPILRSATLDHRVGVNYTLLINDIWGLGLGFSLPLTSFAIYSSGLDLRICFYDFIFRIGFSDWNSYYPIIGVGYSIYF